MALTFCAITDLKSAMIPVFQQATKAGIPVSTYAWGYVSGPGKNYTTVVGEDTGIIASPKSGYVTIALTCWAIIDLKSAIDWLRSE